MAKIPTNEGNLVIRTACRQSVYAPSEDVVVREIEGVLLIVPIVAGIADIEDELLTLNETGKAVWQKLDGRRKLGDIIDMLAAEYSGNPQEVEEDVLGLACELLRRRMIVEAAAG